MDWEILRQTRCAVLRRSGRFIVAELGQAHDVLSTSATNGGQTRHLKYLVNHQSCEGAGHDERFSVIHDQGEAAYHESLCAEIGLPPDATASMGTAANMNYAAVVAKDDGDVSVLAVVTAGVHTNATCAGDPATWRENPDETPGKVAPVAGTINTMFLIDRPLTASALARTIVTMTEGKSAALQRLAVPSCYSSDLATGTGTDQFIVAAPVEGRAPLTSASPHTKFGEAIGAAVRDATLEALRWQNGLEASYTRGLVHALKRYGVREDTLLAELEALMPPAEFALLKKNVHSVLFEPMAGAAAHALAAVLDRARHGTLPDAGIADALVQQAALLAANIAARPESWPRFRTDLHALRNCEAKTLVVHAIALGLEPQVAHALIGFLAPNATALAAAVLADLLLGDPEYPFHPVRLMGAMLTGVEKLLRGVGASGYLGGILLFLALAGFWLALLCGVVALAGVRIAWLGWGLHVFVLYSLLALGDLLHHVRRVEHAAQNDDLAGARSAVARLVGRDVERMDLGACRRAAIESLSENLTDGFTSAIFWYALLGLPGIVLFKVVSTMDSMVGNKTSRYIRFGWCGARLDDAMNFIPAGLTWLLIAANAAFVPGCSAAKALKCGWLQHGLLPSPNSGWSEAATAGGIQRRLVGPIRMNGELVTEIWLGAPRDSPASSHDDVRRAIALVSATGVFSAALACAALFLLVR